MNFVNGQIKGEKECDNAILNLEASILKTLEKPPLDIAKVISACDRMVANLDNLEISKTMYEAVGNTFLENKYVNEIKQMFNAKTIETRIKVELGDDYPRTITYIENSKTAIQTIKPLGVLFHITAGNAEGLPFVSLLEGLLTGNINIVKIPKEDKITIAVANELVKIESLLSEYIYIFDYSSKDSNIMRKLADISDAVVIWGGDEAVSAVRKLTKPNTKIIEWGHKLSFAYVTKDGVTDEKLTDLAKHICTTEQLYCSSCQGIFYDTDNMEDIYIFCNRFLPILDLVSESEMFTLDEATKLFVQAEVTLRNYEREVEDTTSEIKVFRGNNCSITAFPDSKLEVSMMYRNLFVKPLKKENILYLRPYKNYLQTVAVLSSKEEYQELAERFLKMGVVKISDGYNMSNYALFEAHDGMFPLRNYTKIVSIEEHN